MKKRLFKKSILILLISLGVLLGVVCCISYHVTRVTIDKITTVDKLVESGYTADAILVLGAKVNGNTPSLMLRDRLDKALELHKSTYIPLIMSGDCSGEEYNEVRVMKKYATDLGIDESIILTDPEGYSTFESIDHLEKGFGVEKVVIITQRYHLPRALYIAEKKGLEAVGVAAEDISYFGHAKRLVREHIAQVKDYFLCMFK